MSRHVDVNVSSIRQIATALVNCADSFSFVIREEKSFSNEALGLIACLKPHLIEAKRISEWAGTKLIWGMADLYIYNLNDETAYLLYTSELNLYKWIMPHRPEDLIFYRNKKPFFISITHEKEAYFELEDIDDEVENYLRANALI